MPALKGQDQLLDANTRKMSNTKKELASGVYYTMLAKYSNIVVQLVVTAILARLLTPEDFGVVTIATVFIVFFNLISDIGIGPAIIQFKDLDQNDLCQIFSFTAYVGVVMSLLFFGSSWLIAAYYDSTILLPVCQLLSLAILFFCLNIVPQNLQYKRKRFRFVAFVSLTANFVSAVVAIILALCGFGVFSLVFQQILCICIIFLVYYKQDRFALNIKIDRKPLERIFSFSVYQFLFNFINYFSRNLDKLLIGRFIGVASLGQYDKSYRLMLLPLQNITNVVTPVMQPIFSNFQNNLYEMAEKYKKLFTFLCYIGFPVSVLLFFTGEELILLFFGDQWYEAVPPFKILSLTVGLQILNGTTGSMYQSANATKYLFLSGCITALLMISGFLIAIIGWKTIEAVAVGFSIAQLLNSIQVYYMLFKILKYPISLIINEMIYPVIISFVIGLFIYLSLPLYANLAMIYTLIIKCFIGLVLWYLLVNFIGPHKGVINTFIGKLKTKSSEMAIM